MKTEDWQLESFEWLSKSQWNVDHLVGPYYESKGLCKICDAYIDNKDLNQHVKKHLKEYERLMQKRKRRAAAKRKEALKLAREVRKNKKQRDDIEREYLEGEIDE